MKRALGVFMAFVGVNAFFTSFFIGQNWNDWALWQFALVLNLMIGGFVIAAIGGWLVTS